MNRITFGCLSLFVLAALFVSPWGDREAGARVGVGVEVGLPSFVISAPPALVVIPETYVYMVPDISVEILFYHGFWYRPYGGVWYRATSYNGPWVVLSPYRVPQALLTLPPDHRWVPPGYRRIPYADLRGNWSRWERERYWDRDRDWHAGWHRPEAGRSHEFREERHGRVEGRGGPERGRGHEEHEGRGGRHG